MVCYTDDHMITSILEFFALGTFGFWLLCSLLSIVFIACLENESQWFPTVAVIAVTAIYWKPLAALGLTWQSIGLGILIYAAAGVAWSIYRWFRFVKFKADECRKTYGTSLTESQRSSLKRDISVSENKSRITGWIAYWPWSLVWNITGDFFKTIYENLQGIYQKITDKAVGDFTVNKEVVTDADRSWRK